MDRGGVWRLYALSWPTTYRGSVSEVQLQHRGCTICQRYYSRSMQAIALVMIVICWWCAKSLCASDVERAKGGVGQRRCTTSNESTSDGEKPIAEVLHPTLIPFLSLALLLLLYLILPFLLPFLLSHIVLESCQLELPGDVHSFFLTLLTAVSLAFMGRRGLNSQAALI